MYRGLYRYSYTNPVCLLLVQTSYRSGLFSSKAGPLQLIFRIAVIPNTLATGALTLLYFGGGYLTEPLSSPALDLLALWGSIFLSDFHGYLILVPLAISWYSNRQPFIRHRADVVFLALSAASLIALIFISTLWIPGIIYLSPILGILLTIRFGSRGASLFMFCLSLSLTWATALHLTTFALDSNHHDFITLILFICGTGLPLFLLAAEANARQRVLASLESTVDQRTLELAHAKDIAEQANQDKSRFLAAAGHDLRQPLHALNLQLEKARYQALDNVKVDFSAIEYSVNSLNILFKEVLDISKLDAGATEVNLHRFAISSIFAVLERDFKQQAQNKGLSLEITCTSAWVESDFILLLRVLQNLTNNAIKYSRSGTIYIRCMENDQHHCIEIQDSGEGISEQDLQHVNKAFFQSDNPHQDSQEGVGLGLSIVQRLCQLLQIEFDIHSQAGKGTCIRLQVAACEAAPFKQANSPILPPLHGAAILVVDNEETIVKATQRLLQHWGCAAIAACNLEQALQAIEDEEIDLILCDYRVTDTLTGLKVIEEVNQRLDQPAPAIVITAETEENIITAIQRCGYKALFKPTAPDKLHGAISEALFP